MLSNMELKTSLSTESLSMLSIFDKFIIEYEVIRNKEQWFTLYTTESDKMARIISASESATNDSVFQIYTGQNQFQHASHLSKPIIFLLYYHQNFSAQAK